jgi:ABC-2 type transport system permease protein
MNAQARAILWAQFRSLRNYLPRASRGGVVFSILVSVLWYGLWLSLAVLASSLLADPGDPTPARLMFSGGLFSVFLYWQVVPVLMAATGASLETKKLMVYPITKAQLFGVDVLLRVTTGIEMLLVLAGAAVGLARNPKLAWWAPLVILLFVVFNLCVASGTREILARIFARKRVREAAVFLLVLCGALPQLLVAMSESGKYRGWLEIPKAWLGGRLAEVLGGLMPWPSAAGAVFGDRRGLSLLMLLGWTAAAYAYGRWQFERGLSFDADAARATDASKERTLGLADWIAAWPSHVFADPLAALVEKEIRFLSRAPRFRLVFTMGFTFGLVIWLPIASRSGGGVMSQNLLTLVSLYALLLLGDVCFWNIFGFDRRAAQFYFVAPVRFSTVLIAKNITALFFVLLEITMIIVVCWLLRMPITGAKLIEAYAVTLVIALYLVAVGTLTSSHNPRPVDPAKSMRQGAAGKMQAVLVLIYPVAGMPVLLAYGARYAFDSDLAFYGGLAVAAGIGAAIYWVSMESSVEAAANQREMIVDRLSQGEGPIGT